jgi:hypothetical protein
MGRQIAVAMEPEEEETFLAFLHGASNIALYRSWSPRPDPVESFTHENEASTFWIHNLSFPWQPSFERVEYTDETTGEAGAYFRLNTLHAPVLEYSRHPIHASNPQVGGRLYWAKLYMSQPSEIVYSLTDFDAWFTSVAKWVRRQGKKVRHGSTEPWFLPAARRKLQMDSNPL